MGFIYSKLWFFYCFLRLSENNLITDREEMKKYMFLPACENFNLIIYNILNQKILQYKNSEFKQEHTVIRLRNHLKICCKRFIVLILLQIIEYSWK